MDGLDDLALFAAVVAEGGFSAAARSLGIPKSRISRRIADLEQRLGVRLLQRSTRTVKVTDIGARFYRHCEAVQRAARAAYEVAELGRMHPSGPLRVTCPVGVAYRFLAPILPRFMLDHPDVRLELELTNRLVDVIGEGVDIALRACVAMDDSELVVRHFGESRQVLVASPAFLQRSGPINSIEALRGCAGIGPACLPGAVPHWSLQGKAGQLHELEYKQVFVSDDLYMLEKTVLAGVGLAQLPFKLCADAIENGKLVRMLPEYELPTHQFHAVFPTRRGLVPAVRAFIDLLVAELPLTVAGPSHGSTIWHASRRPQRLEEL